MKCNNCGAPLQLDQKFCPNCGSPNEQGLKHANDMENYNRKFNRTRSKVISNSKWFVKNITPIAVVMLSAIVLAAALLRITQCLAIVLLKEIIRDIIKPTMMRYRYSLKNYWIMKIMEHFMNCIIQQTA